MAFRIQGEVISVCIFGYSINTLLIQGYTRSPSQLTLPVQLARSRCAFGEHRVVGVQQQPLRGRSSMHFRLSSFLPHSATQNHCGCLGCLLSILLPHRSKKLPTSLASARHPNLLPPHSVDASYPPFPQSQFGLRDKAGKDKLVDCKTTPPSTKQRQPADMT